MFVIPGYEIKEKIQEDNRIIIYKGYETGGQRSVLIKVLKDINPYAVARFFYEWETTENLEIKGILPSIKLEKMEDSFALIIDDTGANFLCDYIQNYSLDIPAFLDIAMQMGEIIGELHQKGIIHRNLKLENILIHLETGQIKITDFSQAVRIFDYNKQSVESVPDYRHDIYALGIVFYEMLTGQSFEKKQDPGDLYLDDQIPGALLAIIRKLVAENPEERYQSGYGLVKDLEECRRQWNLNGQIKPFLLGQMDVSYRLKLPWKIYGRKSEKEALLNVYHKACSSEGEITLVTGFAGTGKTTLVNETLKQIALENGFFGYGKFDQLSESIPYAPLVTALGGVFRQLMTESKEQLEQWKRKILWALGRNGAVLTGLIPELKMIIGNQPAIETLQLQEAQNRLFLVFGNLIKTLTRKNHPLVIFLDDLQWADISSLQLVRYLCRDTGFKNLVLVGAYRENEVSTEHPLLTVLEEMKEDGVQVKQINLAPFSLAETREFIVGILQCSEEKAYSLADVLYRKTYGIPFFLEQLLKTIYDYELITFNMKKGCWEWDLGSIQKLQIPKDIMRLMLEKLQKLPAEIIEILKIASCMGNSFNLAILSVVCELPETTTTSLLDQVVREGIILPVSKLEKEVQKYSSNNNINFEFLHDTVRQAAYLLLSEAEKKKIHLKVGKILLENLQGEGFNNIFFILDHINRGLDLINVESERLKLARYNLVAGRKAKSSASYNLALNYLRAGMKLLPKNSWKQYYYLSCNLYLERAQCEYLVGEVALAEKLFEIITGQVKTELEKADVYNLKMILYAGTGKCAEAVQLGRRALGNLGMKLPASPGLLDNAKELLQYKLQVRNKSIKDLEKVPEMKDPVQRKVAELLISFIFTTCTNHPELYSFAIIKAGNHALKYGNTDIAAIGYLGYSIVEGSVLENFKAGSEWGKVSLVLVERYNKSVSKCVVYFTYGSLIVHWTENGKAGLEYLNKALQYALETGNVLIAGFSYGFILENKYLMGIELNEIKNEVERCKSFAKKMNHENLADNAAICEQLVSALISENTNFILKDYNKFNDKASQAAYYFAKLQLSYLYGYFSEAFSAAEKMKKYTGAIMGSMLSAVYNFYCSLVITAVYNKLPVTARKKLKKNLKKNQKKMKKWSDSCPENFSHYYLLVEGEICSISGKKQEAEKLYDKAIEVAHENGYVHIEALACELAARFYLNDKRERIARAYLSDAFNLYQEWGAMGKVQELEARYADLLEDVVAEEQKKKDIYHLEKILKNVFLSTANSNDSTINNQEINILKRDILSISESSNLDLQLENFLDLAVKSTGSTKGYLILENEDELFIEVIRDTNNSQIEQPILLEESNNLAKFVVRYVARTLKPVVINNKSQIGIFARDPYISDSGVKALACLPLQLNNIPVGILYLENNLKTEVFTEERQQLLKYIAKQMFYARAVQAYFERSCLAKKIEAGLPVTNSLTEKEKEVLELIAAGLSNKEIAEKLNTSVNTVKTHIKNIYGKLQVNRRVQVVSRAKELKIL